MKTNRVGEGGEGVVEVGGWDSYGEREMQIFIEGEREGQGGGGWREDEGKREWGGIEDGDRQTDRRGYRVRERERGRGREGEREGGRGREGEGEKQTDRQRV